MKKIIITGIVFLLIIISYFTYPVITNRKYFSNEIKKITKNYGKLDIKYFNKYGYYYILKDKENIIVLNEEYKEVLKKEITSTSNMDDAEIVYRRDKLMHEITELKKKEIIYTYYNIETNEEIEKVTVRR